MPDAEVTSQGYQSIQLAAQHNHEATQAPDQTDTNSMLLPATPVELNTNSNGSDVTQSCHQLIRSTTLIDVYAQIQILQDADVTECDSLQGSSQHMTKMTKKTNMKDFSMRQRHFTTL